MPRDPASSPAASTPQWCPTIDGDFGMTLNEARSLSRNFFLGGFLGLPLLWFVNCYYFWPVLQSAAQEGGPRRPSHDPLAEDAATETTPALQSAPTQTAGNQHPLIARADPTVLSYARWSAACFVGASAVLCGWVLTFFLAGPTLFGPDRWNKLLVYNVADQLEAWLLNQIS